MDETGRFHAEQQELAAQMAALSHEFKTPLSVTLATLDLMQRKIHKIPGVNVDEYNVLFGIAVRNIYKVLRMTNNFIDVGRLEGGMAVLRFADEDIVQLLRQTEENIVPMLRSRGARISFVCKTNEPLIVPCDAQALDRIMLNLISNSIKHLPQQNGRIFLVLEQETAQSGQEMLRISVTDNGAGIREAALPHLFEQYWHDESEESVDKTSTGLGLYIVKKLVDLHSGTIAVESEPYMATTISICLPLYQPNAEDGVLRSSAVPYDADCYELLLRQALSDFI